MDLTNQNKNRKNKRPNKTELSTMVYGKIPPQAIDLEMCVLGALLIEPNAFYDIKNILRPDDLYKEAHQRILLAAYEIAEMNVPVDILTMVDRLRKKGELEMCGGPYYVTVLTNHVVSSANIVAHSRIVKQYSVLRKVINFSGELIGAAYDDHTDPFELLEQVQQQLFEINQSVEESRTIPNDVVAVKTMQNFEEKRTSDGDPEKEKNYLRSGIKAWDEVTGYYRPGSIYVVAARPGMGKTDILIDMICRMAQNIDVGFISAEMSEEEVCQRIICNTAELDNYIWIKPGRFVLKEEQERMYLGIQNFVNLKLHLEARTTKIDRIVAKIRYWVRKLRVKIVLIDFLQILTVVDEVGKYMTEVQILNRILEQIREVAKEEKVPIILVSQLNRELYKRGNKEPGLSDLKGSGKIEEIAYQISFLHRPEYYEITADDMGESTAGLMYQLILKHRGGKTDRVKHRYVPKYSKVIPWDGALPGNFSPVGVSWTPYKDKNDYGEAIDPSKNDDPF